ncbi:hypothetical protein AMECASPLE_033576 [Ameca splendens]|uniref:Uncharacterized protein n=1 Tax=Ameca splendens TaxID=208324 RepID=A0ABV1ADY9_9TELE
MRDLDRETQRANVSLLANRRTSSTGSKGVIRSSIKVKGLQIKLCFQRVSQQRRCLYDAKWSSFSSLKEGHRHRITMVTVTVQLVGGQSEPSFTQSYGG